MLRFLRAHAFTLLLLAAVAAGTAWVVRTKRPPGAMTVIEAQAMDMTVMRAPVGPMPVWATTLKPEPFQATVRASGTVEAREGETVVARTAGRVVEVPVLPGDRVAAGQVLLRLDAVEPTALEKAGARVRSLQGDLDSARLRVERAEARVALGLSESEAARAETDLAEGRARYWDAELREARALTDQGTLPREELEAVEAEWDLARRALARKRAALETATARLAEDRQALQAARAGRAQAQAEAEAARALVVRSLAAQATVREYAEIRARGQGEVAERLVGPGDVVLPGTALLRLRQPGRLRLEARVPAREADALRPGARVTARPRSGGAFEARVVAVARLDAGTARVTAEPANPLTRKLVLRPGDAVDLEIATTPGPVTTLSVPEEALRWDLEGRPYVWIVAPAPPRPGSTKWTCTMHPEVAAAAAGSCPSCMMDLVPVDRSGNLQARRQLVEVGERGGMQVAVLKGLQPGARVIVLGHEDLREGMAVSAAEWTRGGPGPMEDELPAAAPPPPGEPSAAPTTPAATPPAVPASPAVLSASPPPAPPGAVGALYTCPMHPEVRSPEAGRCPKCKMKLEEGGAK